MNKYLMTAIMLIVPFIFFSCKEDIELKEGVYEFNTSGNYTCRGHTEDFVYTEYLKIIKINSNLYEIRSLFYYDSLLPKSTISIYDDNKVKATYYYAQDEYSIVEFDGILTEDRIDGDFNSFMPCIAQGPGPYDTLLGYSPLKGTFELIFQKYW